MCELTANIFFNVLVVTFPIRSAHFCDPGNSNVADSDPEPETEFKEFEPRLKFKLRFGGDLRRDLNSLNSDTEQYIINKLVYNRDIYFLYTSIP